MRQRPAGKAPALCATICERAKRARQESGFHGRRTRFSVQPARTRTTAMVPRGKRSRTKKPCGPGRGASYLTVVLYARAFHAGDGSRCRRRIGTNTLRQASSKSLNAATFVSSDFQDQGATNKPGRTYIGFRPGRQPLFGKATL